ncbi:MAG: ComF family protein [Anaerolineaceae bacterium]
MADKYTLLLSGYKALWNCVDWIFPPNCAGCGVEGYQICPECLQKIQFSSRESCVKCGRSLPGGGICPRCRSHPPAYQEVRSLAGYEGVIREIVVNLKYKADLGLSLAAAEMMARVVQDENWQLDMVVPVPLNEKRRKARGYNQAAVLAFPLSLSLRLPLRVKALARIRDTKSQVPLNVAERKANVQGAFLADPLLVRGRRVLLVDDVYTTGATLNAAAEALRSAGCGVVWVLTLAKALDHQVAVDIVPPNKV